MFYYEQKQKSAFQCDLRMNLPVCTDTVCVETKITDKLLTINNKQGSRDNIFASFLLPLCKKYKFSGWHVLLERTSVYGWSVADGDNWVTGEHLPGCQKSRLLVEGQNSLSLLAPSVYTLRPTRFAPDHASTRDRTCFDISSELLN